MAKSKQDKDDDNEKIDIGRDRVKFANPRRTEIVGQKLN